MSCPKKKRLNAVRGLRLWTNQVCLASRGLWLEFSVPTYLLTFDVVLLIAKRRLHGYEIRQVYVVVAVEVEGEAGVGVDVD